MVGPNMSNIQRFPCTYCMVQSATVVFVCRGWLGWGGGGGTPPSRAKPPQEKKPPDEVRIFHHILCKCNTKTAWNWLNEV